MTTFRVNKCICTVGKKYKYIQYAKPVRKQFILEQGRSDYIYSVKKMQFNSKQRFVKMYLKASFRLSLFQYNVQ